MLEAANDFSVTQHPHFRVRLLRPPGAGEINWGLATELLSKATETSNLKFDHTEHLDAEKVPAPGGGALGCSSCHTLSADGEHFRPITMAGQCASCHDLSFDPEQLDRQLPHGKPPEVIATIQEYFVRRALDPSAARPQREYRRLPGKVAPEKNANSCSAATLACGQQNAREEIEKQFNVKGCATCHVVQDMQATNIAERFNVLPVRLVYDYMPSARFDHRKHLVQNDQSGDKACLSCHRADQSKESSQLLMPDIEKCVDCHGGPTSTKRIQSTCMSCHHFHPQDVTGDLTRRSAAGMLQ
jgi:predicted CXXCH cytochrome family protein